MPNWKLAKSLCANFGSIEPVMAQKRTNYSKFTQPNGTIQVLMLWASVALHLMIGSNLGLFGRLDPIKVKPAGGTVRVVDLTPAEQTRVPEAAKSKPLPIAPTPVNPETATRAPANPNNAGRSGASSFVPPRVVTRPQMPSSQVPQPPTVRQPSSPSIPSAPLVNRVNGSDIPIPRPPRLSGQENEGASNPSEGKSVARGRPSRKSVADESTPNSSGDTSSTSRAQISKTPSDTSPNKVTPKNPGETNSTSEERKKIQIAVAARTSAGSNFIRVEVPKKFQENSSCEQYKSIDMAWPIDENGNQDLSTFGGDNYTREEIFPDDKISRKQRNQAISIAKSTHAEMSLSKKKELISKYKKNSPNFAYYAFKMPIC